MRGNKNKWLKYLAVIVVTAVVSVTVAGYVSGCMDYLILKSVIRKNFVGEVDEKKLDEAALSAMIESLEDTHTFYIGEGYGIDQYIGDVTGEYSGIGVEILGQRDGKGVVILSVYDDSPAQKAGIVAGDIIASIDGVDVTEEDTTSIVKRVRGEKGEKIKIGVLRSDELIETEAIRDHIMVKTVKYETIDEFGYIDISMFGQTTPAEFDRALSALKESSKGIIIDLRDNPGGLLTAVHEMADSLLDGGTIVTIKYKKGKQNILSASEASYTMPLVILINENSASASEIMSAAIKENKRGMLVGMNTYGKGTVQQPFKLTGNTGVSMTVAKFYSPDGNEIDKNGVSPDYEVAFSGKHLADKNADTQFQKALEVLRQHTSGD